MAPNSYYKYCIVPCCKNTTHNTPEKLFFSVPKGKKRQAWCKAMKRDDKKNAKLTPNSSLFCCEDHFTLEEDMANYMQYRLANNVGILKLKPGVLPHRFACQRSSVVRQQRKSAVERLNRQTIVEEAMQDYDLNLQIAENEVSSPSEPSSPAQSNIISDICSPEEMDVAFIATSSLTTYCDKSSQVNIKPSIRSKKVGTFSTCTTEVALSPIKFSTCTTEVALSPIKFSTTPVSSPQTRKEEKMDVEENTGESDSFDSSYSCSSEAATANSSLDEVETMVLKEQCLNNTMSKIEKEPKLYLGIPQKSFYIIQLLEGETSLSKRDIFIVLKKIRLNPSFAILGMDFGLSATQIGRIFEKALPLIAKKLKSLIVWPSKEKVCKNLPIPFRARYSRVVSILDCLEIEIEKPGDSVHQSLTWSNYYNCNTIKYLVSCTPDGLINFMSAGFGGRATDAIIVKDSGFLDLLTTGDVLMADRGFKDVSKILAERSCTLVRPPSVSATKCSTKNEVKQSKRIAALRIHVERLIGRLRDFKMVLPHSCVDKSHIKILDDIVITVCGIVNMQDNFIRNMI